MQVVRLGRGYAWLDTGTVNSLYDAGEFVKAVEMRTGVHISVLEEIAYDRGWITKDVLAQSSRDYGKSPYGMYLKKVVDGKILTDK